MPEVKSKRRTHPANPKIRQRIAVAMDLNNVNQPWLAKKVGTTVSAISQILSGATVPEDDTGHRIAKALGEDFEFIMAHTDKGKKGYGLLYAELMARLDADQTLYLHGLPEDDLNAMISTHALKADAEKRKAKRLRGKTPTSKKV